MGYYIGDIVKLRVAFFDAHKKGDFIEALNLGDEIIDLYKENEDCKSLEYATDLYNLAVVYDDICNFGKALEIYKEAAEVKRNVAGEGSITYGDTLNNMAVVYSRIEKYSEAERLYRKVLEIREKKLGSNHIDYVLSLYNLANASVDLKRYDTAIEFFKKALVKAKRMDNFKKTDFVDIMCSLARAYGKKGNYKESIYNYSRVIQLMKEMEGENSFYYLSNLLSVASVCEKAEKYELSIDYYKKAIYVRSLLMEKTHLDYITNLNSLASVYIKTKKFELSIHTYKEALSIIENIMGKEHIFYADELNNIGTVYCEMGEYDKAIEYVNKALDIKRQTSGENNFNYASSLSSLGNMYRARGEFDKAIEIQNKALDIRMNNSMESFQCIESYMALGKTYFEKKEYQNSEKFYTKAVKMRIKLSDKKDSAYVWNVQLLAETVAAKGNIDRAVELCKNALEVKKNIYGMSHPKYAKGLCNLADMQVRCIDYENAVNNYDEALVIYEESLGTSSEAYLLNLEKMASTYFDNECYFDAITSYKKRIELIDKQEEKFKEAIFLAQIGECYYYLEEYQEAEDYYQLALTAFENENNCKSYLYLNVMMDLARLYEDRAQWMTANRYLKECLYTQEKYEGTKNKKYTEIQLSVAKNLNKWGKTQDAIEVLNKALQTRIELFGDESRESCETLIMLGDVYNTNKTIDTALEYYLKGAKGAEEEEYVKSAYECGHIYYMKKDYMNALKMLNNSKSCMEEYLDTSEPLYSKILYELGSVLEETADYVNAAKMLMGCVEFRKVNKIRNDTHYISELEKLGDILCELDDMQGAIEYYSESALLIREFYGESIEFSNQMVKTAAIQKRLGKKEEALALYEKALKIFEIENGKNNINWITYAIETADIYFEYEDYKETISRLEDIYNTVKQSPNKSLFDKKCTDKLLRAYKENKELKKMLLLKIGKL